MLEEMCGGEREACRSFVLENLETLKVVLLETLKNASSPAKRVRPLCSEGELTLPYTGLHVLIFTVLSDAILTFVFMSFLFSAETEVSEPHCGKAQRGTQNLYHFPAA